MQERGVSRQWGVDVYDIRREVLRYQFVYGVCEFFGFWNYEEGDVLVLNYLVVQYVNLRRERILNLDICKSYIFKFVVSWFLLGLQKQYG